MRLLREPLVHFLLLGAALFVLYDLVADPDDRATDRIVVSAGRIDQLSEVFTRTWQRPPTAAELGRLIEDHVRDEVYYREARAMGLDLDDTVIRRRLRQKLEFLTVDLLTESDPTPEQVRRYFDEHADAFRGPTRFVFQQIYFNPELRNGRAADDATALLARLSVADLQADPAELGDPIYLPTGSVPLSESEVAQRFGQDFAAALTELPVGRWSGPVESGFGHHLVRIQQRQPGALPPLETVRDSVEREWHNARREEAAESFYRQLRQRYDVRIEHSAAPEGTRGSDLAELRQ